MKVYIVQYVYDTETGADEIWSVHATRESAEAALAAYDGPMTYKNPFGTVYPQIYITEYAVEP